ncbi:MAG TPA: hypothetical protein GX405_15290 [Rhizobiales bacterium]|nr:hypothetical protein [Hyphomicrobiales bacterium]
MSKTMGTVRKEFDEDEVRPRSRKNRLGNMRWFFIASCVAIGFVFGLALALMFFVWAVPPFVRPTNESTPWAFIELDDKLSQWIIALSSILATAVSALAVYFVRKTLDENSETNRIAAEAYAVDSTPFLILKPVDGQKFELDAQGYPTTALLCEIENTGRGPATVTAIFRSWQSVDPNESPKTAEEVAREPVDRWSREEIQIPVGPSGKTPKIYSLSAEYRHRKNSINEVNKTIWIYYIGYIEYILSVSMTKYISSFCYIYRYDKPELGIHVTFPTNPDRYWYSRKLN